MCWLSTNIVVLIFKIGSILISYSVPVATIIVFPKLSVAGVKVELGVSDSLLGARVGETVGVGVTGDLLGARIKKVVGFPVIGHDPVLVIS